MIIGMPLQTSAPTRSQFDLVLSKLLEPDVLLLERYLGTYGRKAPLQPEKALMFAVLNDAVETLQKFAGSKSKRGRALYRDAGAWIRREEDSWLFSFNNICDVLGLDPQFLRQGLLRWEADESGQRPLATMKAAS